VSASTSPSASGSSYTQKVISVTITLGKGTFGQTGLNTVKLTAPPLRVIATILKGAFPSMDTAEVRMYGLPPSIMNSVSTLGVPLLMMRQGNTMLVEAGDAVNGMAVVWNGYIRQAWQDYSDAPDTFLNLIGNTGVQGKITPVAPLSFPGTADVATIMAGLAQQMGWGFENGGVQVKIASPYLAGTALDQAHALARAANIEMYADSSTSPITLAIWPKTGTRGGMIPAINAASGLVGYPQFQDSGMGFRTLYNPNIKLGGQIQMQSSIGGATTQPQGTAPTAQTGGPNGTWYVQAPLVHNLSAQEPGGPWFTDVSCIRVLGGVPS